MNYHQRRCIKVWQILIACAMERRTITYGQAADLVGERGVFALNLGRRHLDPVSAFCARNRLPELAVLVVNGDTGRPGDRIGMAPEQVDDERERVFAVNWFGVEPPIPDDFP